MSGHSKWATTKRAKAVVDAKRGNLFTKLSNNIVVAARQGGSNMDSNFKLRMAIEKAKAASMPKENIERAIKRGTGELQGQIIEETVYGGLLPGQYPVIIKCLSDNKNRTLNEIKTALQKGGGQLVDLNAVAWQFENKGVIKIKNQELKINGEELEMKVIEAGPDDYEIGDDEITIYTKPEDLQRVKESLEKSGLKIDSADLEMVAKEKKEVADREVEKIQNIFEGLEELEDVSDYYTNIK